jgi:pimeloyl-ACP methyl ester carboxylesterase
MNKFGITRRELGALAAAAIIAPRAAAQASNPVLDIADWSYKFYGVEHALLARGTVCNGMQMYVEHWIPRGSVLPYPVVLVHGAYGQGSDWLSTPDGRRGWVSLFLEEGFEVYLVDRPGQGRNPYQPFIHGAFDSEAQTFEHVARTVRGTGSKQWPGSDDPTDPAVAQLVAAMGQPMRRSAQTLAVWRTRGAMLLDESGESIFVTLGDGAEFAQAAALERPGLVKAIVGLEPSTVMGTDPGGIPQLGVVGEASREPADGMMRLVDKGIRGNGPMLMMEKNNREVFAAVLDWLKTNVIKNTITLKENDPHPNRESTALRLADQGGFWVGVNRKTMPYGTIPQGQMFVQYMIPADRRHPLPVVMTHGGGGQGTHMMGIGGRPGWVHYFVQAGYAVYWIDRPSYGRSPYHPDALGPSHLPNVPAYEGLLTSTAVFNTAQWPGPGGMNDPFIDQFMACESGNVTDEAFHSDLAWKGGVELVDRIGPCILIDHAFGGFFGWGVADRRPNLIKAIYNMEINGNPFAAQLRWGLTASPMTYDPPVTDLSQFKLVDHTEPPDSPRPVPASYKLQAEPAHKWKNLQHIPMAWMTSEFGGGGSPVANVEFLKQVGCDIEMVRLRDYGIYGNGNLMLLDKNNHEVFVLIRDWLDRKLGAANRA